MTCNCCAWIKILIYHMFGKNKTLIKKKNEIQIIKEKKADLSSMLSVFVSSHLPIKVCPSIEIPQGFSWLQNRTYKKNQIIRYWCTMKNAMHILICPGILLWPCKNYHWGPLWIWKAKISSDLIYPSPFLFPSKILSSTLYHCNGTFHLNCSCASISRLHTDNNNDN